MITKNMIDAGWTAYYMNRFPSDFDSDIMITAIYEAMADQKQKDALIEYHKVSTLSEHE